jgi:ATP-binding cassette subfamily C protein
MLCVSLTEGIGLLLLVPLLELVGVSVERGGIGRLADSVAAAFAIVGFRPTLASVLGVYVLIVSGRALLQRSQAIGTAALEQHFVLHLRRRLYHSISAAQWLLLSRTRSPDLVHALTKELDRVSGATSQLLNLIAQLLVGAVYLLLALKLSAAMTLAAAASSIGLMLLLRAGTRNTRLVGERLSTTSEALFSATMEHLAGLKTARSYGAELRNTRIFSDLSERVAQVWIDAQRSFAGVRVGFEIGSVLILSVVLYMAVAVLQLAAAGVLLLLFLFARLVPRFSAVQQSYQYLVHALPAFERVSQLIAECEAAPEVIGMDRVHMGQLRSGIELKAVTFSYNPGKQPATLTNLNLSIPAHRTTALVGPSGAGKSTVADLVIGLVTPDLGSVYVDRVSLEASRLGAWRDQIGYVAQDTFLFHDTVRANLLWAHPEATEAEIWESLRLAAADGFVSRLPEGLDTIVGDRGVRLSGGERQRLALARALLRKPSLLILDEATSALDSENERRIQQAIEALHGDITILIITHRLSAIRGADIIHVLENGRVVESGSWDALTTDRGGRFHALWSEQAAHVSRSPAEQRPVVIS